MIPKLAVKPSKATVVSLECQLAQVQMKRFLNGDNIPEELLKELEAHLRACPDCLAIAKGEKQAVEAHMVATPAEAAAIRQKMPATSALDVLKQPKTLMLSIGLAVVLIVMSTVLRDPTKLLGAKASTTVAATEEKSKSEDEPKAESTKAHEEEPKTTDTKASEPEKKEPETNTKPATEAAVKPEPPKTTDSTKPKDEQPTGHSTPPGPAASAVQAAREAVKPTTPAPKTTEPPKAATTQPKLNTQPIVEAKEGGAKPSGATKAPAKRPAAKTTRRKPATKAAEGGVKVYKD
ncbi:MAG: hypothetical protein JSS65_04565 [Armatimonadetes bacterium]|nr:hypothetical protein [Armatimonadota bacterium]